MNFYEIVSQKAPLLLDGAMGTMLFELLPGFSGCVEQFNLENPQVVLKIHRAYIEAGADIILTNTFGGSPVKLAQYGLADKCNDINAAAAQIAREAAKGKDVFVAGSIGPSGKLVRPVGDIGPEEIYESFFRQAKSLAKGGVDLLVIETMTDLAEMRLALLAAKEACALPVVCSMSFEENGRTVTGNPLWVAFQTLAECGASAVGINCSMGPDGLFRLYSDHIEKLRELGIPLTVWANAGMPEIVDGKAIYKLNPERFAEMSARFAALGISIIGGCCGTTPAHIAELKKRIASAKALHRAFTRQFRWITSPFSSLDVSTARRPILIGERLNPTARKKFAEELKEGKTAFLRDESKKQELEGAQVLDLNVGVPGIDETKAMQRCVEILITTAKVPLMFDSDNYRVIERALVSYPGVPVINSINAKQKSFETILPLIKKFGSFVVALCMDESGIHRESSKRIAIGESLLEKLCANGIALERIFIDPLILAESAEPGAAMETLKVIHHFAQKGIKTSIGLSNISFGLPQRKFINNAFLNMAIERGLTAAIVNPAAVRISRELTEEEMLARDFLEGRDMRAAKYIARFAHHPSEQKDVSATKEDISSDVLLEVKNLVVEGDSENIVRAIERALNQYSPEEVMNGALIKGLEIVGDLYSQGIYFLPQMIASAQAMKTGFERLKPLLKKESVEKKGTVVICTVKGDVHDIGKNIVAMMLENHGFEVIDLGKDVDVEIAINTAVEKNAQILCLSSLLTTTMGEMERGSKIIKEKNLPLTLIVGGAVVTKEYADRIGARYGADAVEGVKIALEVAKK
ncbi:MAG: homocysteine S-methyltransferase family protein [Spirochaetes bacterium]|nr:homocysteine S-methyltransferase family protein [Spirochaetota bacterium]